MSQSSKQDLGQIPGLILGRIAPQGGIDDDEEAEQVSNELEQVRVPIHKLFPHGGARGN